MPQSLYFATSFAIPDFHGIDLLWHITARIMQSNSVMGQDSVERYIGRILTDDFFRREANLSFDIVCASEGFVFTNEERRSLRGLDYDLFERLSSRIDTGIKRSIAFMEVGGGIPLLGMHVDKGSQL